MSIYHFDDMTLYMNDLTRTEKEQLRLFGYQVKCEQLLVKWYCLLSYGGLEEWFDSNRCCLPIALSRILDPRIIKAETEL